MKKRHAKKAERKLYGGVVTRRQVRGTHAATGGGLRYKRRLRRRALLNPSESAIMRRAMKAAWRKIKGRRG